MPVLLLTFLSGTRALAHPYQAEQWQEPTWSSPCGQLRVTRHPVTPGGKGFFGAPKQAVVDNILWHNKLLPPNQCTEHACCTGNAKKATKPGDPQNVRRSLKTSTRTQNDGNKIKHWTTNISRKVVVLGIHHFVSHIAASLRVGIRWGAELTEHKRAWGWEAAQRLCHYSKVKEKGC